MNKYCAGTLKKKKKLYKLPAGHNMRTGRNFYRLDLDWESKGSFLT